MLFVPGLCKFTALLSIGFNWIHTSSIDNCNYTVSIQFHSNYTTFYNIFVSFLLFIEYTIQPYPDKHKVTLLGDKDRAEHSQMLYPRHGVQSFGYSR